jgi:hypothetical protein
MYIVPEVQPLTMPSRHICRHISHFVHGQSRKPDSQLPHSENHVISCYTDFYHQQAMPDLPAGSKRGEQNV